MAVEHEGGDELAMVRMEHSLLHVLSLIEKSAREAREMRCHGAQLLATAAGIGVEVVTDANVILAAGGRGSARVGPSKKVQVEQEGQMALQMAMAMVKNVLSMAGRLRELVG